MSAEHLARTDLDLLARRQHGVLTRRQAHDGGVSAAAIRTRLRSRRWVSYRGVLRLAEAPDSADARLWSAVLRAGPGVVVSGSSALRRLGLPVQDRQPTVVVEPRRHVNVPDAVVLREVVPDTQIRTHPADALAFVRRDRALVDAARTLPLDEARALVLRAVQQGWVDLGVLSTWCDEHRGRRGARQMRLLIHEARTGAASHLELLMVRLLRRSRIGGWETNLAVHDQAGLIGRVDVGFPAIRLAIEVDGRAYHAEPDRFQRDRSRQNRLVAAGWTVLRFTADDLTARPEEVVATINGAVARLSP